MFIYTTKMFSHQRTPLEIAVEHNHADVVNYLNKLGVSSSNGVIAQTHYNAPS